MQPPVGSIRPIAVLVLAAVICVGAPAGAQNRPPDDRGTFTLLIENDAIFDSDENYSNGL
jgi:hypothetical protein